MYKYEDKKEDIHDQANEENTNKEVNKRKRKK